MTTVNKLTQIPGNNGICQSVNHVDILMVKVKDLEEDWYQIIGLEQQIKAIGNHLSQLRNTIGPKMIDLYNEINDLRKATGTQSPTVTTPTSGNCGHNCDPPSAAIKSTSTKRHGPSLNALPAGQSNVPLKCSDLSQLIQRSRKSDKISALVKGYLTRRLFKTDKVREIVKTIKDTRALLENCLIESDNDAYNGDKDVDFQRRLALQLEKSLADLSEIFFKYSKAEQMKLISRSRDAVRKRLSNNLPSVGGRSSSPSQFEQRLKGIMKKRKEATTVVKNVGFEQAEREEDQTEEYDHQAVREDEQSPSKEEQPSAKKGKTKASVGRKSRQKPKAKVSAKVANKVEPAKEEIRRTHRSNAGRKKT